jgi:NADH oxidase (H2O2-forming)
MATVDSITNPDRMFEEAGIKVVVGKVVQADAVNKTLMLADGGIIHFDKLILGLGARQMVSPLDGSTLRGVFTLRSAADATHIRDYLDAEKPRNLVFIGAGYTNLETASLLLAAKPDFYTATVIELMQYPLPLILDRELAQGVKDYLEEKGLKIKIGEKAVRIVGKDGRVSGVELTSGEEIPADFSLISVGATPNLELAQQLDLP